MNRLAPSISLFTLGVLTLLYTLFSPEGIKEVNNLSSTLMKQENENLELGAKVQALKQEFRLITGDARGIEREARDSFFLVRPNEKLFVFEDKG